MAELLGDKRFAHIGRDPRFREMKKQHHKVKIDKRFRGMFNEKRFKVKYMVDKRGRPVQTSSSDHLRRYYHLSSSENEDSDGSEGEEEGEEKEGKGTDESKKKENQGHGKLKEVAQKKKVKDVERKKKKKPKRGNAKEKLDDETEEDECVIEVDSMNSKAVKDTRKQQRKSVPKNIGVSLKSPKSGTKHLTNKEVNNKDEESSEASYECEDGDDETESSDEETEEDQSDQDVVGKTPDFARGEGLEDSDDSEDSDAEPEIEHDWAELDKDAPEAEAITRRLAVCNMDWDRIKAVDLLVLFNSFKPPEGVIHSIVIYPSEFGVARMKEEEMHGPVELVTNTKDDEETEYNTERLRQYQLKRLQYYYAVVECDTPETASAIYDNCDGTEYESSAAKLDLRYIPDDMTFDQEVKSAARDVPSNYEPSLFVTTALQQSAVELTWDETSKDRIAVTMRKFNKDELDEMNLNDYLASDDDDAPDPYGDLLEAPTFDGEDEERDVEEEGEEEAIRKYQALLQGIQAEDRRKEDKGVEMEVSWGLGLKETTQDIVKKAQKEELTPWETYLQKRREKNRAKREQNTKASDTAVEETAAFSDDELPSGSTEMDFFTETLSEGKADKKKMKKKKKKQMKLTAEEEAKQNEEKAELSLLMMDEDDEREHFSLKEIQDKEKMTKRKRRRKRLVEEEAAAGKDTFLMDLSDNRFEAVFTNPLYNIDPSSHEFKKTKAIENLIDEKVKRCRRDGKSTARVKKSGNEKMENTSVNSEDNTQTDPPRSDSLVQKSDTLALESLIKSVKVKTKLLQDKKKKKVK